MVENFIYSTNQNCSGFFFFFCYTFLDLFFWGGGSGGGMEPRYFMSIICSDDPHEISSLISFLRKQYIVCCNFRWLSIVKVGFI